jgi:predicted PurR-regulated permease PerM
MDESRTRPAPASATEIPTATEPPAPRHEPPANPLAKPVSERRHRNVGWRSRDVARAAALVMGLYLLLRLLWFAHPLFLTAFLGVLFGLAVTAGVDRLSAVRLGRYRLPRGISAAIIVFGVLGLLVAFGAWTAPTLRQQSRELRTKLPEAVDKFDSWAEAHRGGLIGMLLPDEDSTTSTAAPPPAPAAGAHPGAATKSQVPPAVGSAVATAPAGSPLQSVDTGGRQAQRPASATSGGGGGGASSRLRERLVQQLTGAKNYFFPFLTSTFAVFGGLLLVVFLTIYVAAEPDTYHDGLMHLFPHRARARAGEVLTAMATALRKWLLTQLIAMLVIGLVTMGLLFALRIPAALPLGILAGLLEFIPTVGPTLSAIPAIAMGFVDSPEKALYVALGYVGIQFLENHILIPLLMKEGVDLPPALTILAQALMALLFGFLGLLVAVPLLAATVVAVKMLYVQDVVGDGVEVLDAEDG